MRKTIIFFGLLQFGLTLKSQDKIVLYYNAEWILTQKDKAVFHREAEYDLNDFKLSGKVCDYNSLDTLLMVGNYLDGKRNGDFTFYYNDGKIKNRGKYLNNNRVGKWYYYYRNGKLKQVIKFQKRGDILDFAVGEYYDPNGKQLLKKGTGKWFNDSITARNFAGLKSFRLTGQFKDSLKNGEWNLIRISNNKIMHSEQFDYGEFIEAKMFNPLNNDYGTVSSEFIDKIPDENIEKLLRTEKFTIDTTVFPKSLLKSDVETIFKSITGKEYKIKNRKAGYLYGDYSLFDFISKNIHYPVSAIEQGISGKVYVNVIIDSLGTTKDLKVLKGVQNELDNEAIRVVQLIKNWLPALQDGKTIESSITIPVKFSIK